MSKPLGLSDAMKVIASVGLVMALLMTAITISIDRKNEDRQAEKKARQDVYLAQKRVLKEAREQKTHDERENTTRRAPQIPLAPEECDSIRLKQYRTGMRLERELDDLKIEPEYMKKIARNAGMTAAQTVVSLKDREEQISYTAERLASMHAARVFLNQHPLDVENGESPSPEALKWADSVQEPTESRSENLMKEFAEYRRAVVVKKAAEDAYEKHATELKGC